MKPTRIYLTVNTEDRQAIEQIAQEHGTSFVDVLRRCVRVGLMVYQAIQNGDKVLIQNDSGTKELQLL